jgi:hypothetical protein
LPRSIAVIRHAGRREELSFDELLGLDDIPRLPWVKRFFGVGRNQVANRPHVVGAGDPTDTPTSGAKPS